MEPSEATSQQEFNTNKSRSLDGNEHSTRPEGRRRVTATVASQISGNSKFAPNSVRPAHSLSCGGIDTHRDNYLALARPTIRDPPSVLLHHGRHSDNDTCLGAEQILNMDAEQPPGRVLPAESSRESDAKLYLDPRPNEDYLQPVYMQTVSGEMLENTSLFNETRLFSRADRSSSTDAEAPADDHEMPDAETSGDHGPDSPLGNQTAHDADKREPRPEAGSGVPNVHYPEASLEKASTSCSTPHLEDARYNSDSASGHVESSVNSSRNQKKNSKQPKLARKTCHGIQRAIKPPVINRHYWTLPYPCNRPGCLWRFQTSYNWERHISMHEKREGLISNVRMISCPVVGCDTKCTRKENVCSHLWEGHHIRENCPGCGKKFESGGKSYGSDELYKHLTDSTSTCGVRLIQNDKSAVVGFRK